MTKSPATNQCFASLLPTTLAHSSTELALAPCLIKTLPSCIPSLPEIISSLLYQHCVSRPASYSLCIPSSGSLLCAFTNTAVRLKTRRAPRFHSGNFAPRSSSGRRAHLWAAAWTHSVRWRFEATARRGKDSEEFICCAGQKGEPGEATTIRIEPLLHCEEIPAHPYPPALAVLHRRLH